MLEGVHKLLYQKFQDPIQVWDSFIEFIAVDHSPPVLQQLNHKFEWFFEDEKFAHGMIEKYNPSLLQIDFYDHLGEMYLEKIVTKKDAERRGLFVTPMEVATLMAAMTIPQTEKQVNVLDPCVGTGRLLMAGYKMAPNGLFFGVDIDLRALRIAYTNFAIHGIKGYLLHADSLLHETDISTEEGRQNWEYSNKWYSCMDKLHMIKCRDPTDAGRRDLESKIHNPPQNDLFNSQKQ